MLIKHCSASLCFAHCFKAFSTKATTKRNTRLISELTILIVTTLAVANEATETTTLATDKKITFYQHNQMIQHIY